MWVPVAVVRAWEPCTHHQWNGELASVLGTDGGGSAEAPRSMSSEKDCMETSAWMKEGEAGSQPQGTTVASVQSTWLRRQVPDLPPDLKTVNSNR